MTRSAIATQRKKPQTPGQRLHALDPDLAKLFDEWEGDLNQQFDEIEFAAATQADREALNGVHPGDPTIIDAEENLAFELGRFHLAADPFLEVAEQLREDRDAAYMVLGRVEHLIAQRTLEALRITPQAALPAPLVAGGGNGGDGDPCQHEPDPADPGRCVYCHILLPWNYDDDDTEDYRDLRADHADPEGLPVGPDGLPDGTPPWDDPEGAHTTSYRIVGTVVEADTFPTGRKPHRWGRGWWAGATAWCIGLPVVGFGVWMAGLHLLGGRS